MSSIRDKIDILLKKYKNRKKYNILLLDTYSYSELREEIGLDYIEPLDIYKGLSIEIDGESDKTIRIISEDSI